MMLIVKTLLFVLLFFSIRDTHAVDYYQQQEDNFNTQALRLKEKPYYPSLTEINPTEQKNTWDLTNEVKKYERHMFQDAAIAASAAYSRESPDNTHNFDIARNQMIYGAEETIKPLKVNIRKNPLLGDWMTHGEFDAGLVSFGKGPNGRPRITIAFRGTQNIRDMQTDLNGIVPFAQNELISKDGYIHQGMNNRYMESRDYMFQGIMIMLAKRNLKIEDVDFLITGHSLGGGLASIAAVDIKQNLMTPGRGKLDLVTFSSPRVFGNAAAAEVDKVLEGRAYRIWRGNDPVAAVGLNALGYKHIGKSLQLETSESSNILENHNMKSILDDVIFNKNLEFNENYVGYGAAVVNGVKKVASKLNPGNWGRAN